MGIRKSRFITIKGMQIHYSEWGYPGKEAVVCLHGLSRNGRDFDAIARRLSERYWVISPDLIGRGLSQWSKESNKDYCFAVYEQLLVELLNSLGINKLRWIGTSMGGALGIRLGGSVLKDRISCLVLNDIGAGPEAAVSVSKEGIERIVAYLTNPPEFSTLSELSQYYQTIYASFGSLTNEEWTEFTIGSARRKENGCFSPDYDPGIAAQMNHPSDLELWDEWNRIQADVLLIRGEKSDILTQETAQGMLQHGPKCQLVTVRGCGHAPALNTDEQIHVVQAFLEKH
jgi:pimeloyl-ACP methyl ester carboxylesterase